MNWEGFLSTGRFTQEVRDAFDAKLRGLRLSRMQAARRLGVTIPTIEKWLHGPTKHCGIAGRRCLVNFLSQGSDEASMVMEDSVEYGTDEETEGFRSCLHRISEIVNACYPFPEQRERFLKNVRMRHMLLVERLLGK